MHLRKVNLHLSLLLQLQLPIELRCIIIEDYFPFLPNESHILTLEEIKDIANMEHFYKTDYNTVCFNCNFHFYFSWFIGYKDYNSNDKWNNIEINIQ